MARDSVGDLAHRIDGTGAIGPDARVLAMVSGGADSMCLLDILARSHPGRVGVVTMDHGLRPEAQQECALVAHEAALRACPVWIERLEIAAGPNLQARARAARHAAAVDRADREGFDLIATGHTATDQAETVLFRLARGTGRTGAIGMRERTGRLVRPLLALTRAQTRAWCDINGVPYVDDPSNRDLHNGRVRIREQVLPALAAAHPGAVAAINRFARQLADEQQVLDDVVDAAWARCAAQGGVVARHLAVEPVAIARLVARRMLQSAGVVGDERWVEAILAMARSGTGTMDMPGARVAVVGGVIAAVDKAPEPPSAAELSVPGRVRFGERSIVARRATADMPSPMSVSLREARELRVRSPQPGDKIALAGGGHARVGRLLADVGVAAHLRSLVPVVEDAGRIVWVAGYRANPQVLAAPGDNAIRLELV